MRVYCSAQGGLNLGLFMHYLKMFSFIILTCVITSCSYIYGDNKVIANRDTDYLKARSIPPLKIPPGLSSDTIEARYPVSERVYSNVQQPSLIPPELNTTAK